MKEKKSQYSFYLSKSMMDDAHKISNELGITLSQIAQRGLMREVEKYKAIVRLTEDKSVN